MSTTKLRFGKFVIERRRQAGFTQRELAARLHVSESAVSTWERGLSYPDLPLLTALAAELGVTEQELIRASEDQEGRANTRDARTYRTWHSAILWSTLSVYAVALLACFIVNISVQHTLSWFWIVLPAVALAFCLTTLPLLRVPRPGWLALGGSVLSLGVLLAVVWLRLRGFVRRARCGDQKSSCRRDGGPDPRRVHRRLPCPVPRVHGECVVSHHRSGRGPQHGRHRNSDSVTTMGKTVARRGTLFGVLALLGATLFWAGNYVIGGAAVETISPLDLTALRWVIALIPLLLLAHFVERPDWRAVARAWPAMILPALFGPLAYNFLLYSALEHTTPVNASLINAFNPALISIAAAMFLRQRLSGVAVIGIVVALVGVLWVISDGRPSTLIEHGFGLGDMFMVVAIIAWTIYTILGRRKSNIPPLTATAVQCVIVLVITVPLMFATGGPNLPASAGPLWALLFIGLFPSVASFGLWNIALTKIPPARAGVFLNLITVFTVAISLTLGQPITLAQCIGGLIVLAGVFLTNADAFRRTS